MDGWLDLTSVYSYVYIVYIVNYVYCKFMTLMTVCTIKGYMLKSRKETKAKKTDDFYIFSTIDIKLSKCESLALKYKFFHFSS